MCRASCVSSITRTLSLTLKQTSHSASTVARSDQGSRFIGKFREIWDCLVLSDNQHLRMSSPYYAASAEDDLVSSDLLNSLSFFVVANSDLYHNHLVPVGGTPTKPLLLGQ